MADITVIVTCNNEENELAYTLTALVEQTVEDFDVLLADDGSDESATAIAQKYCDEYEGFAYLRVEKTGVAAMRNAAVQRARGEFVLFLDGGDYISPETVEQYRKKQEETKADLLFCRYYFSGDAEPYYNAWADQLAVVPDVPRLDTALLNTADLDGRLYSRRFFDLYSLRFPEQEVAYNAWLTMKCAVSGAKMAGCAGAIYEKRRHPLAESRPDAASFAAFTAVYDEILAWVRAVLEEEAGTVDGDEYSIQEMTTVYFQALTDRFYRCFWFISDEILEQLRMRFETLSAGLTDERRKKINEKNRDLRFPAMYITHNDAAQMPLFSLLLDVVSADTLAPLVRSLYAQRFPFFDLYVKQSDFTSGEYPDEWKTAENLHVLPDKDFFATARADCAGIPLHVKDETPLDSRVLSELSTSRIPKSAMQYQFTRLRKQHGMKKFLKNKGFNIR